MCGTSYHSPTVRWSHHMWRTLYIACFTFTTLDLFHFNLFERTWTTLFQIHTLFVENREYEFYTDNVQLYEINPVFRYIREDVKISWSSAKWAHIIIWSSDSLCGQHHPDLPQGCLYFKSKSPLQKLICIHTLHVYYALAAGNLNQDTQNMQK